MSRSSADKEANFGRENVADPGQVADAPKVVVRKNALLEGETDCTRGKKTPDEGESRFCKHECGVVAITFDLKLYVL